jgi:hypothetical protein
MGYRETIDYLRVGEGRLGRGAGGNGGDEQPRAAEHEGIKRRVLKLVREKGWGFWSRTPFHTTGAARLLGLVVVQGILAGVGFAGLEPSVF